ncbi:MAG: DUF4296 domain-containing protein [Bacteroidota bacterium]|nr:DUF4296 domain-containing protein [Bacteroidota bacterium]
MNFSFLKKIILLPILFVLVFSCGQGGEEDVTVPDNILSEEKFTKILLDFALAESASNINVKNVPAERSDSTYAFDPLVENKVSRAQYDSAIVFYSKHPGLYKKIYENILVSLSKMQVKNDTTKIGQVSK